MSDFKTEMEKLQLEQERFKLEEMKEAHAKRERAKEEKARLSRQMYVDEMQSLEKKRQHQRACTHRKGGKDRQGLTYGNSSDYSIIVHTYATGETRVHCQRCIAEWKPGDTSAVHPTGIGYEEAMRFPTDNTPSGGVTFTIAKQ